MIAVAWGVILSYIAWAVASEHRPTKRRYREIRDRQTGRRVGVASEPIPLEVDPEMMEHYRAGGVLPRRPRPEPRPLFPDRHPWLHRRLRRFGWYMRRQLDALEASYPAR